MINNDRELEVTQERIRQFQRQVAQIRKTETSPENYRLSAAGFLAEIDRMNLEIRDYLWSLPAEQPASAPSPAMHLTPLDPSRCSNVPPRAPVPTMMMSSSDKYLRNILPRVETMPCKPGPARGIR